MRRAALRFDLVACDELGLSGYVSGADIVAVGHSIGLLAIGWRRSTTGGGRVVLNPHANDHVDLGAGDQIVVIG